VLAKILVVLAVCALMVIVAVGVAGYLAVRKASEAVEEAATDPAAKVIKWIERFDPDLEITRQPDGRYRVHNRRTGEETTVDLSQLRKGTFEMTGPGGKKVRVAAEEGGIAIDHDGTVARLGMIGPAPAWLPVYPGSDGYGTGLGASGLPWLPAELAGTKAWRLTLSDPPEKVLAWYGERLEAEGFEVGAPEGFSLGGSQETAAGRCITARQRRDPREVRVFVLGGEAGGTKRTEVVVALHD